MNPGDAEGAVVAGAGCTAVALADDWVAVVLAAVWDAALTAVATVAAWVLAAVPSDDATSDAAKMKTEQTNNKMLKTATTRTKIPPD